MAAAPLPRSHRLRRRPEPRLNGSPNSIHASVSRCVSVRSNSNPHRLRVVGERYEAGVIAQIEVLDAEYALLQAQLDLTRAQAAVRLAEAQLTRALGR